jgi:hypothetical protein
MNKKPRREKKLSLREQLAALFDATVLEDFKAHSAEVIQSLRKENIGKYAEIVVKLIAASEPKAPGIEDCQTQAEMGRRLLPALGVSEEGLTEDMIAAAVEANETYMNTLTRIAAGH